MQNKSGDNDTHLSNVVCWNRQHQKNRNLNQIVLKSMNEAKDNSPNLRTIPGIRTLRWDKRKLWLLLLSYVERNSSGNALPLSTAHKTFILNVSLPSLMVYIRVSLSLFQWVLPTPPKKKSCSHIIKFTEQIES